MTAVLRCLLFNTASYTVLLCLVNVIQYLQWHTIPQLSPHAVDCLQDFFFFMLLTLTTAFKIRQFI